MENPLCALHSLGSRRPSAPPHRPPPPLPPAGLRAGRRLAGADSDAADGCLPAIRALAPHDAQLGAGAEPESSRMWQKQGAGAAAPDAAAFQALMAQEESQGLDYVCHHTADWVRGARGGQEDGNGCAAGRQA